MTIPTEYLLCGTDAPPSHLQVVDEKGGAIVGRVCASHTVWELVKAGFLITAERGDESD